MLIAYFLLVVLFGLSTAQCPHDATDLEDWSDPATWDNGQVPLTNSNVTITSPVLLDSANVDLFSITIGPGGRLVFSADKDHVLRVHYILIEGGGEMHIGGEQPGCKYDKYATIELLGEPGELDIPGFGEKFIGVKKGGILELHGKDKLSWTKIARTIPKTDPDDLYKFNLRRAPGRIMAPGLFIVRFTQDGHLISSIHEAISKGNNRKLQQKLDRIESFLATIEDDDVVAISTQKEVITNKDLTRLMTMLDDAIGTHRFREVVRDSAYAFIGIRGEDVSKEDVQFLTSDSTSARAVVSLEIAETNTKFIVESFNDNNKESSSYSDFITLDLAVSEPIIDVVSDVTSWIPGDKIFITSTDYDWKQVEEFTLLQCQECQVNQLKLNAPFAYSHYGEIFKNVDMRAEVGLMTRHILIRGIVSEGNTNGGHVKFLKEFKSVRVEGVELTKMGQPFVLGRYPLHYHMCEDLDNSTMYPIRSYIRGNSIHHTHFRCTTIHGTHGALVLNNVCYDTFGHGFFLEDGGEKRTHLEGNLGLGQRAVNDSSVGAVGVTGTIPTDRTPVTFWLTNPQTTIKNNAAAGGDGVGMWFVYPDLPTGPSKDKGYMKNLEARHTAIKEFYNNVAHSYIKAGLFVDNIEQPDLTVKGYNQYDPRLNATNKKSPQVRALFTKLTAYKNRRQNAWIRGGWMVLEQSSVSDSLNGVSMVRENGHYLEFLDSVVIGESDNLGEPASFKHNKQLVNWHRSIPFGDYDNPRIGSNLHKGAVQVDNVWFGHFQSNPYYEMGAIGFRKCGHQSFEIFQATSNLMFGFDDSASTGNRVYNNDNPSCRNMFIDGDGTVTGISHPEMTVINNHPFFTTELCKTRSNWNMAYCPLLYGSLGISYSQDDTEVNVMRTDPPFAQRKYSEGMMPGFVTMLGDMTSYLVYFEESIPNTFKFTGRGVTKSDHMQLAVCIPKDAEFSLKFKIGKQRISHTNVSSVSEVYGDNKGGKYFFDSTVGVLFFKLVNDKDFTDGEIKLCPGGKDCPSLIIELTGGDLTDNDCTSAFKANTGYTGVNLGLPTDDSNVLPLTSQNPPDGLGADSTFPFQMSV